MDIANIVNRQFDACENNWQSIYNARLKALKFYRQENDKYIPVLSQDSSTVKTSNVRDIVETTLPQVLEPFLVGEAVVFVGDDTPIDKQFVDIETDKVNKVLDVDNNRFEIFEMWFRDALLQKNGYVKTYVEEIETRKPEKVDGLNSDQLAQLQMALDGQEIDDLTIEADINGEKFDPKDLDVNNLNLALFNVSFVHIKRKEKIKISNVAPENILVSPTWDKVGLKGCPYVCERIFMMRSDLKELYPDYVKEIEAAQSYYDNESEEHTARKQDDLKGLTNGLDRESDIIEFREHYIKAVLDDSGKAKYWKVCTVGNNVLDIKQVDDNPYDCLTPIRQPHTHYGLSLADLMIDIDEIDTAVWRANLDAMYRSLMLRPIIDLNQADPETTFQDLSNTHPMAPIRVRSAGAVSWTSPPDVSRYTEKLFPLIDAMLEKRTGLSRMAQGLDATALAESTNQVGSMVMNQSLQRIKMILRTFAETGVRNLMLRIRKMLLELNMLPNGAPDDRDVDVKVGVGLSDKNERIVQSQRTLELLKEIIAQQGGVSPFGMVNENNAYSFVMDYLKELGVINREQYITNPANIQQPPPQETPVDAALEVEKGKMMVQANAKAAELEFEAKKHNDDLRLELLKLEAQEKEKGRQFQLELARLRENARKGVDYGTQG